MNPTTGPWAESPRGANQPVRAPGLVVGYRTMRRERSSASAVGDAALAEVIGRQFNLHLVAGENTNIVLAHLAGNMRIDYVAIFQADAEGGVWQGVDDFPFHFNMIFFCHAVAILKILH